MKKLIASLILTAVSVNSAVTAYAADILSKDYIEEAIWEDMWLGKGDDGTEFPEASYKHHILEKWIDDNYGSDNYDWSAIGELKYKYKDYYNDLIKDWDFNDDNGEWTIDTADNSYHFLLVNGKWNMLDCDNNVVDVFLVFSTIEEETENSNVHLIDESNTGNIVIGNIPARTEKPSDSPDNSGGKVSADTDERAAEGNSERSESNALPLAVGGFMILGIGTAAVIIYRKKK